MIAAIAQPFSPLVTSHGAYRSLHFRVLELQADAVERFLELCVAGDLSNSFVQFVKVVLLVLGLLVSTELCQKALLPLSLLRGENRSSWLINRLKVARLA